MPKAISFLSIDGSDGSSGIVEPCCNTVFVFGQSRWCWSMGFKLAEGWNSDPYSSCVPVDTDCSVVVRSKLWSLSN